MLGVDFFMFNKFKLFLKAKYICSIYFPGADPYQATASGVYPIDSAINAGLLTLTTLVKALIVHHLLFSAHKKKI